jgi:hypothetical protein
MIRLRTAALAFSAVAALAAALTSPALARKKPVDHARFSKAPAYLGVPALATTLAMVDAGGGVANFDSVKLVRVLAGERTTAEVSSLQQKFGADNVKSFLEVFDFVVNDAVAKITAAKVALPTAPNPSPSDGRALAAALYALGVDPLAKTFDIEYMLDALVTHPIHLAVMDDIDEKYGRSADGNYHAVFTQTMVDLKAAYRF